MRYKKYLPILAITMLGCNDSLRTTTDSTKSMNDVVVESNDNDTMVNTRDRDDKTKTAFDQGNNPKDIQITADIRKRVVDTNMSTSAHNVKIITLDGKVTLRGTVASLTEKESIEKIARDVAGADSVSNQIEVQ